MKTTQRAIKAVSAFLGNKEKPTKHLKPLSLSQRRSIVNTFSNLLEGLYVHLPQKRASYGQDPIQRLRALNQRLDEMQDTEFHRNMAEIITQLRDAHTRYLGPQAIGGKVAVLPFLVERYTDQQGDHFLASKVFQGDTQQTAYFTHNGFISGVEITHWNGIKIGRALELHAEKETGGRPDVRLARALESLTLRPLRYALPPDEDWIEVTFLNKGNRGSIKLEWNYMQFADSPHSSEMISMAALAYAGDPCAETQRRVKKMFYSPDIWYQSHLKLKSAQKMAAKAQSPEPIPDEFSDAVRGETWLSNDGLEYGYLRLWGFDLIDDDGFIRHVIDLLKKMPRSGLIIDLRGNPGGLIWAAERLLQLFSPNKIEPTRFSMLATDVSRTMASAPQNHHSLSAWRSSLESAVINGERHSRTVPLTPVEQCNNIGQRYPGPVVALVDASTYSSGDLFAAGFVDNKIGILVSIDEATGAGGANVWRSNQVVQALQNTQNAQQILPAGVEYTISLRRASRIGENLGTSIEDNGVRGNFQRALTKRDLMEGNRDIKEFCSQLLSTESLTDLNFKFVSGKLEVSCTNLDRIELYVNDRPYGPPIELNEQAVIPSTYTLQQNWTKLEILGFKGDVLRQRRLISPDAIT